MIIKFDKKKSVNENNKEILTEIAKLDFSLMEENELIIMADSLFKLFKGNFENSNYSEMNKISHYCKFVVDSCINRKLHIEKHCGEVIIDIACFVFEQMYMYEDKVLSLKAIIHSNDADKCLRVRALKEIMSPEPEVQSLINEDMHKFSAMLQQLSN